MNCIPRRGSIHPVYPWCVAEDSRVTKNIELTSEKDCLGGRGITISTVYRCLTLHEPRDEDNDDEDQFITKNYPWLLPAQDYKVFPIKLEESQNCLYRFGKWEPTDMHDNLNDAGNDDNNWKNENREDRTVERCRKIPFETTAQTKLVGTKNRTILGVSFWYYILSDWFEKEFVLEFQESINQEEMEIAGETYEAGTVLLTELSPEPDVWERSDGQFDTLGKVSVQLQIDPQTWWRKHENVATVFNNFDIKRDENTHRPLLDKHGDIYGKDEDEKVIKSLGREKLYAALFDPDQQSNMDTTSSDRPFYQPDPSKLLQYIGSKTECHEMAYDGQVTEITDPMYIDKHGFPIWPDETTGLQTPTHWVEGYPNPLKEWNKLRLPTKR